MKEKKGRSRILLYAAFAIRISFGLFAMTVAVLFFLETIGKANERLSYAMCYLIPVIAAVIVGGDLYLRWKQFMFDRDRYREYNSTVKSVSGRGATPHRR